MSKAMITVEGYVARDVEVNHTQGGKAVATVVVPHTPRRKSRDTGEFEDAGPTTWFEASCWERDAEAAGALVKGDYVVVTGQPQLETYEKRDGTGGAKVAIKFATVGLVRSARQGAAGGVNANASGGWAVPGAGGPQNAAKGFDPAAQRQHVQGGGSYDEAPF